MRGGGGRVGNMLHEKQPKHIDEVVGDVRVYGFRVVTTFVPHLWERHGNHM